MTGNKNAWRAPLAGLASVAMIATMGVAASTANANGTATKPASGVFATVTIDAGTASKLAGKVRSNGWTVVDGKYTTYVTAGQTLGNALSNLSDLATDAYTVDLDSFTLKQDNGTCVIPGKANVAATTFGLANQWTLSASYAMTRTNVTILDEKGNPDSSSFAATANSKANLPAGNQYYKDVLSGRVFKGGDSFTTGNADSTRTFQKITEPVNGYVAFDAAAGHFTGDENVKREYVERNADGFVKAASTPSLDDSTFEGWTLPSTGVVLEAGASTHTDPVTGAKYVTDLNGVKLAKGAVLTARFNESTKANMVTFHYGSYSGAPADEYAKFAPNSLVTVPSKPARENYLFKGWYEDKNFNGKLDGDEAYYNATTDLAGQYFKNKQWILTADWQLPSKSDAEAALAYVPAVDDPQVHTAAGSKAANAAKAFTSDSWDKFTTVYKKALVEFKQANWNLSNGEVNAATAKSIIDELQAGWKDLRFNNGVVDSNIDGNFGWQTNDSKKDGAELVYRLATPDGQRHFMTSDENEVLIRTNKLSGAGAWKLESASTFRMVDRQYTFAYTDKNGAAKSFNWTDKAAAGDQGKVSDDLGYETDADTTGKVTLPLIKTVTRLYNSVSQEWLYTTSQAEVTNLTTLPNSDWGVDSDASALFTPALYSTSKEVARFYNPKTGLHFYTTDKAEINFWTVQHPGIWTKETTGIYAL